MANLNKVMLIGNLTRDPEVRFTPKGTAVGDIGLAVNRRVNDGNGNWSDEVTFVDVTVWGANAENAQKYLTKGRGVFIEGRLELDTWEDKQSGQKRQKLKVVAEVLQFLPDGKGGERQESGQRNPQGGRDRTPADSYVPGSRGAQQQQSHNGAGDGPDDDDIPFRQHTPPLGC